MGGLLPGPMPLGGRTTVPGTEALGRPTPFAGNPFRRAGAPTGPEGGRSPPPACLAAAGRQLEFWICERFALMEL
jgi:hypothetical protein